MLAKFGKTMSTCGNKGELGNDVELFRFESKSDRLFAECGEIVLVGSADLLDQAVNAEPFQ